MTYGSDLVLFLFVRMTGGSISDLVRAAVVAYLAVVTISMLIPSYMTLDFFCDPVKSHLHSCLNFPPK